MYLDVSARIVFFLQTLFTHPVAHRARVSASTRWHRVRFPDADYLPLLEMSKANFLLFYDALSKRFSDFPNFKARTTWNFFLFTQLPRWKFARE